MLALRGAHNRGLLFLSLGAGRKHWLWEDEPKLSATLGFLRRDEKEGFRCGSQHEDKCVACPHAAWRRYRLMPASESALASEHLGGRA